MRNRKQCINADIQTLSTAMNANIYETDVGKIHRIILLKT